MFKDKYYLNKSLILLKQAVKDQTIIQETELDPQCLKKQRHNKWEAFFSRLIKRIKL